MEGEGRGGIHEVMQGEGRRLSSAGEKKKLFGNFFFFFNFL